jgi:glutaredoxin
MTFDNFWESWHVKGRKGKRYARKAFDKLTDEEKTKAIEQAKIHTDTFNELAEKYGTEIFGSMKFPQGWLNQKRFDQPHCGIPDFVLKGAGLGGKVPFPQKRKSKYAVNAYYQ